MKVFTLQTVIMGHQGTGVGFAYPVKCFDDEGVAKQAREEHGSMVKDVIEMGSIIMIVEGKPKKVMTVGQFLGMLGIGNVAQVIMSGDVHSSSLVVPSTSIIIPGKN